MSGQRVAIITLGCKVNAYDSATIADRLTAAGCRVVADDAPAEVVILNSCTVTDAADAEVLVEQRRDPHSDLLRGYTRNYTRVVLAGPDELRGRRVRVRLAVGSERTVTGTVAA